MVAWFPLPSPEVYNPLRCLQTATKLLPHVARSDVFAPFGQAASEIRARSDGQAYRQRGCPSPGNATGTGNAQSSDTKSAEPAVDAKAVEGAGGGAKLSRWGRLKSIFI